MSCLNQPWESLISLLIFALSLNCYRNRATSLPLTAEPLFKDTPFAVIWNAPTSVCQHFDVPLDFSAFQAVTTPASVPDQFLFLFYSDRLGLYPYTDVTTGQKYNGGIPQKGNLTDSLETASLDVSQYIPEFTSGLAVIDWESWHPLWDRNWDSKSTYQKLSIQYAMEIDPSLSSSEALNAAKDQFQKAARSYMQDTVELGIRERPKYLWGYYLFPECYNYNWEDPGYTGDCPEITKRRNDELIWLWQSSTALFPSAYLPLAMREKPSAALFVRGQVSEAVRVSALPKQIYTPPIYVYLQPLYKDQNTIYLSEDDLFRTIGESAALGAAGAVLWGASADYNTKVACEALSDYLNTTANPYVANMTAAAKLCSETLCQGNGRCVRKNTNSDDYLYLNHDHFHIQKYGEKYIAIGVPSQSDLNVFVDRFTCQCYMGKKCAANLSISPPKTTLVIKVSF